MRSVYSMPLSAMLVAALLVPRSQGGPSSLARVAWLSGCWRLEAGTRVIDEQWMAPRGSVMMGMSRTVRSGEVVDWEFLRLHEAGDRLVYEATPSGQNPTAFLSLLVSDSLVVFENPAHDFPTRIAYRRLRPDSVVAEISGNAGGVPRVIRFPFARAPCP